MDLLAVSYTVPAIYNSSALNGSNEISSNKLFEGYSTGLLNFASAVCLIFLIIGVPGNFITIIALARCKKIRNATAVFIINLSLSDLFFCCFNLPLQTSTFWHRRWTHGELLCRLFPLMRYGLLAVSLFTILAITINRYIMISHPRYYPRIYKHKYLGLMVAATWLSAFGTLIKTWLGSWGRFGLDVEIGSCSILPDKNGISPKEYFFVFAFALPCFFIIVCYARIFYIVRRAAIRTQEPIASNPSLTILQKKNKIPTPNISSSNEDSQQRSSINLNENTDSLDEKNTRNKNVVNNGRRYLNKNIDEKLKFIDTSFESEMSNSISSEPALPQDAMPTTYVNTNKVDNLKVSNFNKLKDRTNSSPSLNKDQSRFNSSSTIALNKSVEFLNQNDENIQSYRIISNHDSDDEEKNPSKFNTNLKNINSQSMNLIEPTSTSGIDTGDDISIKAPTKIYKSSKRPSMHMKISKNKSKDVLRKLSTAASGTSILYPGRMTGKDRRLLKMILVIFISFLICYLPITITKLFHRANNIHFLNIMSYLLIYLTTCINPFIYVVMSSEYRQAYRNLILCRPSLRRRRSGAR